MKTTLLLILVLVTSSRTIAAQPMNISVGDITPDVVFVPVEPQTIASVTMKTSQGPKEVYFAETARAEIVKILGIERSRVEIYKVNEGGGLTFLSAKASADKGIYKVFIDYMKYSDERVGQTEQRVRVGVGVRITATIQTSERSIDLGSVFALGVAYKKGSISGSIEVINVGVHNATIKVPLPSGGAGLSDESLLSAIQSASTLSAIIDNEATVLTPYIIAIGKPVPGSSTGVQQ